MLVHGDLKSHEVARDKLAQVRALVEEALASPRGLDRHSLLVSALIEAGELAQGVADAAFRAAGDRDGPSPSADAVMALVTSLAGLCGRSWHSGFADDGGLPAAEFDACAGVLDDPRTLEITRPEGYAFYALYPESYFEAARQCAAGPWQVIGVRSIGTSLAAMVAAALRSGVPITVRPTGHPFDRQVRSDHDPARGAEMQYAIVDEGPGLSGSSLAAVGRWLDGLGIASGRRHLFTSHGHGPGPEASVETRTMFERTPVHVGEFDPVILQASRPAHRLETWVAGVVGPLTAPLRELGGGRWRAGQRRPSAEDLPPAHPWQERRKFLAESGDGRWLVKFAGLGRIGRRKLERARALAAAGFTMAPAGWCHGFLIERWADHGVPLPAESGAPLPAAWLERIGAYLGFRARSFPAPAQSGASLEQLHRMGLHNTEEAFGAGAGARWEAWTPRLQALEARCARVETDNRLQRWEWLVLDGRLVKTDALDHHAGHDLVGCQDMAWDVVGAAVEFGLDAVGERRLAGMVAAHSAWHDDEDLRDFLRPCYLAFQMGYWRMAEAASHDAEETARLRATKRRYEQGLRAALGDC